MFQLLGVIALFDLSLYRTIIVTGLKKELNIPVIRSNQTAPAPPYPYLSYTITTLMNDKNGTWGEYADGYNRKPFTQVWSITIQSDNSEQAMNLCIKARDWLDRVGKTYLNDNGVIVQSVGAINNRDNLITIEYEYRMGFDCTMWFLNVLDSSTEENGQIETVEFNQ